MSGAPNWTAREEYLLGTLVEQHIPRARIAARLHRTPGAIRERCWKLGVRLKDSGYSATQVAGMMGIDSKTVGWWCDQGWLVSYCWLVCKDAKRLRAIEHDDLVAFLEREDCWHLWEPARILDRDLRKWAMGLRGHVRFLTVGEAASVMGYTEGAINCALREGRLHGVKHGPNWLIREDRLVMPDARRGVPWRRVTAEDVAQIKTLWGRMPATTIARALGISATAVADHAARLGLPRVGRGYWRERPEEAPRWGRKKAMA